MFQKILVIYNEKQSKRHLSTVERVKNILEGRKIKSKLVQIKDVNETDFKDMDLVVTIGGDGTFTKAGNLVRKQFIVGINSEPEFSEGAMTSMLESEMNIFEEILDNKFCVIQRERARVIKNKVPIKELVVNDVYIGAGMQFHTSRYIINYGGREEEHRSSGVIIATGSGSNAWYKSAGGKPFGDNEKKLKFLVREPYSGNRVFKPKILEGEIGIGEKLVFKSTRNSGGIIAIDNCIYEFNSGDIVEIEMCDEPLNILVRK